MINTYLPATLAEKLATIELDWPVGVFTKDGKAMVKNPMPEPFRNGKTRFREAKSERFMWIFSGYQQLLKACNSTLTKYCLLEFV